MRDYMLEFFVAAIIIIFIALLGGLMWAYIFARKKTKEEAAYYDRLNMNRMNATQVTHNPLNPMVLPSTTYRNGDYEDTPVTYEDEEDHIGGLAAMMVLHDSINSPDEPMQGGGGTFGGGGASGGYDIPEVNEATEDPITSNTTQADDATTDNDEPDSTDNSSDDSSSDSSSDSSDSSD